jgi:hypothetical protein
MQKDLREQFGDLLEEVIAACLKLQHKVAGLP